MEFICCTVAFFACVLGRICGIGGGVIIKPVLDAMGTLDAVSVNFLSGCTVLGMSCWSVIKSLRSGRGTLSLSVSTPLALGAAIGGLIGKRLFTSAVAGLELQSVSRVQAGVLLVATLLTFLYTMCREQIAGYLAVPWYAGVGIGLVLGLIGTFLGIGGGPFHIAALYFFYSMPAKAAAQNSLYIILCSQAVGMLSGGIPSFPIGLLLGMAACGVLGSECGTRISQSLDEAGTAKLFEIAMLLVAAICIYNIWSV